MKIIITAACCFMFNFLHAQANLPVKELQGNKKLPFVLYLSGDGGFNNFTNTLVQNINTKGYEVACVNSRSYFWKKKTPQQTADDIAYYISKKITSRTNSLFVLIGYSFGADVVPFVINRLPDAVKKHLQSGISLAIAPNTNFEIHLSEMLGSSQKNGFAVLPEINRLGNTKFTIIQSDDEIDFPLKSVNLKNYRGLTLAGNHHFDDNIASVASLLIGCF